MAAAFDAGVDAGVVVLGVEGVNGALLIVTESMAGEELADTGADNWVPIQIDANNRIAVEQLKCLPYALHEVVVAAVV